MRKKIFLSLILAGLVMPQFLSAKDIVKASSCVKWSLGLVTFYTGHQTVDVYDNVSGELITSYEKPCGVNRQQKVD